MTDNTAAKKKNPEKIAFLRSLPQGIKESLTKEEVNAFLDDAPWPESLYEKLQDFIEEAG